MVNDCIRLVLCVILLAAGGVFAFWRMRHHRPKVSTLAALTLWSAAVLVSYFLERDSWFALDTASFISQR